MITRQFVAAKVADGSGATIVSDAFSSVGFTHIYAEAKWEGAATTFALTDNQSSSGFTYGTMADHSNNDMHTQCGWFPITAAASHTVTMTLGAARTFKRLHIWLINATSGVIALYKEVIDKGTAASVTMENFHTNVPTASFFTVGEYSAVTYSALTPAWSLNYQATDFAASRDDMQDANMLTQLTYSASMDYVARLTSLRETVSSVALGYKRRRAHSHNAIFKRRSRGY